MVCFEMTSLLTKITLQITIDIIFEQSNLLSLPVPELERLLIMYTKDVQFQFDDTIRHQNSVEMGSPPSSVLAELLTANFEKTKLKGVINEMICYAGYVDDTFIVCNDQQQTKHLVDVFRDAVTNIQFTMEYEKDNEFHFFNITVQQRYDGTVQHSAYRKDTWDDIYMKFNSFCSISYKTALIKTLPQKGTDMYFQYTESKITER